MIKWLSISDKKIVNCLIKHIQNDYQISDKCVYHLKQTISIVNTREIRDKIFVSMLIKKGLLELK